MQEKRRRGVNCSGMSQPVAEADTWPPGPTSGPVVSAPAPRNLSRDLIFIAYAVFITTLAQDKVLGNLPIKFWLKNDLGVTKTQLASFWFWAGLAWYLKPVFGLIIDSFPLLGTRRRWWMIGSSVLAAGAWGLVSLGRHQYVTMLLGEVLLGVLMVVASTIMGALLVEAGQRNGATGRVSSVREFVSGGCSLIAGPVGGWLATRAFGLTAGIGAGLLISLAVVAFFLLPEKPVAKRNERVWVEAGQQLKLVFASKTLWSAAGLLVLFFFSPGISTPLFYRQTNLLHFSANFLGTGLTLASSIAAMVGAATYGLVCRRFNLRFMLYVGIALNTVGGMLYYGYHPTHLEAIFIEIAAGFLGTLGVLPLYDLATRATPRGGEAMGYALMMAARNVALFGADVVGSYLQDRFNMPWNVLVLLSAGTTALCLIVIPFLPGILMRHREGENMGEANVTGEQISGPEPTIQHPS